MILYRNVTISFQVGCEVDDETAKKLIEQARNQEFENSLKATFELLRLTDKPLDGMMNDFYKSIDNLYPYVYIPNKDYETNSHLEDEEGNVISYAD